jgi:hypothetical protein
MNANKSFYAQALVGAEKHIAELEILVITQTAAGNYYINQLAKARASKARYEAILA